MVVFGVIDMVFWDIKGKLVNMLFYDLFGGKFCDGVMVYVYVIGVDLFDLMDFVVFYVEQGYKVVCVQCGIFGMFMVSYVVFEEKGGIGDYIIDFSGIILKIEIWDLDKYMCFMFDVLGELCDCFGFDFKLFYDVYYCLLLCEVVVFIKVVEFVGFYWFEDLILVED